MVLPVLLLPAEPGPESWLTASLDALRSLHFIFSLHCFLRSLLQARCWAWLRSPQRRSMTAFCAIFLLLSRPPRWERFSIHSTKRRQRPREGKSLLGSSPRSGPLRSAFLLFRMCSTSSTSSTIPAL